ncbi:MAG: LamG-like jellyroll fold domain-containing protein [Sedimentisphaerales bacterium]
MCKKMIYLISFVLVLGLVGNAAIADPFQQDPGPDGIVSIEAENFDDNILKGASYWEFVTSTDVFTPPNGFSGGGAMQSMPATLLGGSSWDTGYGENAPRLDYQVNFVKTGTYYVWILAYAMDGNSDSCHAGLDGEETPLSNRMSGWNNTYSWANGRYERPEPSQIEITTRGLHVLNIWPREDGITVDKIILTTNPDYRPTGIGPAQSHRGRLLKAYKPSPDDGAQYKDTWVSLSWSAGETAVSHDVYFGDNFNDVNDGTPDSSGFRGNQNGTFYVAGFPGFAFPDGLITGTTYYWRIDEVEADGTTIHKGDVWSFTIPPRTAYNPNPADGSKFTDPNTILSWSAGLGAKLHHVYFGDSFEDVNAGTPGTYKGPIADTTYSPGTLVSDKAYYWRIDEFAIPNTYKGNIWSFRTMPQIPITEPNLIAWWKLDEGSGTIALDGSGHGNHGTLQGNPQRTDGFDGDAIELDGTNYVELSTGFLGSDKGSVCLWIKTTQAEIGMIFYGASDTSGNGFGDNNELHINMMSGGGVEFYIEGGDTDVNPQASAVNDNSWHHITATWDINGLANLYVDGGTPVSANHTGNDFQLTGRIRLGRPNAYERFYSGSIDDVRVYDYVLSLDEIAIIMRGDVSLAWNPKPVNGAISNIDDVSYVSWSPGDFAAQHDVYFGTDKNAVANADSSTADIYRGRQGATSYTPPGGVEWGQTYYWRIDESNTDGTVSKGRMCVFTIADHIIVDDFEDYDIGSNEIWWEWKDGIGYASHPTLPPYPGNGTGSMVGDETTSSYTEETIVHGGKQAMPLLYDNNQQGKFKYSEVEKTLTYPRDWTKHGIGVLSLWFRGNPAGLLEEPAGTYTMSATGADIWGTVDEFRYAWKQLSGAGTISAQVLSVRNTDPWAKCGVMVRQTLDPSSKFAAVYITPGNGCRFQARLTPGSDATSDTSVATAQQMAITAPYWIKLERDAAGNFNGYYSSNGVSWQAMPWNPQRISMPQNVYIGLALTSHSSGVTCKAEFSNVQTTGTVTPMIWTHEAIGITMAANDPEPIYVALNGSAVVFHDNPYAALIDTWTQWNIDLQAFADQGVNLANVNTIAIGFGDKKNPQPGGSGKAYFDDIRLHR